MVGAEWEPKRDGWLKKFNAGRGVTDRSWRPSMATSPCRKDAEACLQS